ncbi:MAG: hypothetical protein AAF211_27585, partial [Myxococcota bacterium]
EQNTAAGNGGGIVVLGDLTLSDSVVRGNAGLLGGGLYIDRGQVDILGGLLTENEARGATGGALFVAGGSTVTLQADVLGNLAASEGGGIAATAQDTLLDVQASSFGQAGTPDDNLPSDVSWDPTLTLGANETFCFGTLCP